MKFSILSLVSAAYAHMIINTPMPRSQDELDSLTGPCGKGADSPVAGLRTKVAANGFNISIEVADRKAKLEFNVGLGSDPKTFPIRIANSTASLEVKKFVLDFKSIVGLKNNDQLTVQVIEVSSDGVKYGCVDVTASL
jgi:hypothetical protein